MHFRSFRASQVCIGLLAALALAPLDAAAQHASTPDGTGSGYAASRLPSWLWFSGEERARLESLNGAGFTAGSDAYPLQRLRLQLGVRVRPWLKLAVEGQDSRVFFHDVSPAPASLRNPMDLRQGYVEAGDVETGWISVRAGRQSLNFGKGRLVEDSNWSNTGLTFDAVRLTLRSDRFRVDAFTGAPNKINPDGFDRPARAERLHGFYGSLEKLIPNATLEPYLFWRRMDLSFGEGAAADKLDTRTTGFRWAGMLPLGFDYEMEMALQRGRQAEERVSAWASSWAFGYTPIQSRHRPRLFAELSRASGDRNPRDGVHGRFNSLYAGTVDAYDTASLFGNTNLVHARPGVEFQLRERLAFAFAYHSYWRASRFDGLYNGPGQLIVAPEVSSGKHIGQGADIQTTWSPVRNTSLELTAGRLLPGAFLRSGGRGSAYNYLFLSVTQRF